MTPWEWHFRYLREVLIYWTPATFPLGNCGDTIGESLSKSQITLIGESF